MDTTMTQIPNTSVNVMDSNMSLPVSATETPPPGWELSFVKTCWTLLTNFFAFAHFSYMSEDGDPMDQNENLSEFCVGHHQRVTVEHPSIRFALLYRFNNNISSLLFSISEYFTTSIPGHASDVSRSDILVLDQLLWTQSSRWRNLSCISTFDNCWRLHRSFEFGAILSRSAVEREPKWGRRADKEAHRKRRPIVLYWRRGVRRMSQWFKHFRSKSQLQLTLWMASGDRLQNTTGL